MNIPQICSTACTGKGTGSRTSTEVVPVGLERSGTVKTVSSATASACRTCNSNPRWTHLLPAKAYKMGVKSVRPFVKQGDDNARVTIVGVKCFKAVASIACWMACTTSQPTARTSSITVPSSSSRKDMALAWSSSTLSGSVSFTA